MWNNPKHILHFLYPRKNNPYRHVMPKTWDFDSECNNINIDEFY